MQHFHGRALRKCHILNAFKWIYFGGGEEDGGSLHKRDRIAITQPLLSYVGVRGAHALSAARLYLSVWIQPYIDYYSSLSSSSFRITLELAAHRAKSSQFFFANLSAKKVTAAVSHTPY